MKVIAVDIYMSIDQSASLSAWYSSGKFFNNATIRTSAETVEVLSTNESAALDQNMARNMQLGFMQRFLRQLAS